jgi:hypothetical protein
MFEVGDLVKCKATSNGNQPYPNWVGKILSFKELDRKFHTETVYLVAFDPSYTVSEGVYLFGSDLEKAPDSVRWGYN